MVLFLFVRFFANGISALPEDDFIPSYNVFNIILRLSWFIIWWFGTKSTNSANISAFVSENWRKRSYYILASRLQYAFMV